MAVRAVFQLVAPTPDTVWADAGVADATSAARLIATVSAVRRIHLVMAGILAPLLLLITAGAASAHPGLEDPYVPAHRLTAVVMGVPSEELAPMVEVDIALPASFSLERVDPTPGWQSSPAPGHLTFTGNAPQGQYVQFDFAGVFGQKAVLEIPVITRAADGTVRNWDGAPAAPYPAALAFPGYPRGTAPIPGVTSGPGGHRTLVWAARIFVLIGAIVVAGLLVTRRRRPPVTRRAR